MSKKIMWAVLLAAVLALLIVMPTIHIDAGAVISSSAISYIRAALYFVPVGTCSAILTIIMGLWVFRVIVALVKAVWNILPVGGGGND